MASAERSGITAVPAADLLVNALSDTAIGLAIFTIGGRCLRANPALCRLLGYSEQELLQKTHLDLVHLDDLEAAAVSRAQVISGKAKARVSLRRYVHKDGSTVFAQVSGSVVKDASGAPLATVLIVDDVSALKRSVRKGKRRFQRMVEMSSDWYWMQDEQFRFIEVPGLDEEPGTDVEIDKTRWEIASLAPLPEGVWQQHRAKLERHETFTDFVFLRHNKAGELRYLSVSGEPLFDEAGVFRGYHGVGKDITERARDQRALEESEMRYRALFDVHPHPMWVVDASTLAFLAVNRAAVSLYGYTKEEFLGMRADQIRPEEDVDDLRKAFDDPGNYRQRIWRHRRKDGVFLPVKVTSFNLDFDGRRARLGVIEDLTERMQAEQRVQESEKRYQELLEEREKRGTS